MWIDETGSNTKDHIRKFGYAIRGITPVTHRVLVRGKRVNSIAALTSTGILAVETKLGTVDGHTFFDFVRGTLIPNPSMELTHIPSSSWTIALYTTSRK